MKTTIVEKNPNMIPLVLLMHEQNITAGECAKALGISVASFSKRINGYIEFTLSEIWKLAKLLNIPPERMPYFFPDPNDTTEVKKIYAV